jgi:Ca2+-binding EF-hand superfamily protein
VRGGNKDKKYDYTSAFNMFDEEGAGSIATADFIIILMRLQLITQLSDSQIPSLLALFDKKKKGSISLDDFINFSEAGKGQDDEDAGHFVDDDDEGDDEFVGQSSNKPPG